MDPAREGRPPEPEGRQPFPEGPQSAPEGRLPAHEGRPPDLEARPGNPEYELPVLMARLDELDRSIEANRPRWKHYWPLIGNVIVMVVLVGAGRGELTHVWPVFVALAAGNGGAAYVYLGMYRKYRSLLTQRDRLIEEIGWYRSADLPEPEAPASLPSPTSPDRTAP